MFIVANDLMSSLNETTGALFDNEGERVTEPSNIESYAVREDIIGSEGNSNYLGSDDDGVLAAASNISLIAYQSSGSIMEQIPIINPPPNDVGLQFGTSGCHNREIFGGSDSSFMTSVRKRKAGEGSSRVSYSAEGLGYLMEIGRNQRYDLSSQANASDNLNLFIPAEVPNMATRQVIPTNMVTTSLISDHERLGGMNISNANQQNDLPYIPASGGGVPTHSDFMLSRASVSPRLSHLIQRRSQVSSAILHGSSSATLGISAPWNGPLFTSRGDSAQRYGSSSSSHSVSSGGRVQVTGVEESLRGHLTLFHRLLERGIPSPRPTIWGSEPGSTSNTSASSSQSRIISRSLSWPPSWIYRQHTHAYNYVTSSHHPPSQSVTDQIHMPIYSSPTLSRNLLPYGHASENHNPIVSAPEIPTDRPIGGRAEFPHMSPNFPVDPAGRQRLLSQIRELIRAMNVNELHQPANTQEAPMGPNLRALIQSMLSILDDADGGIVRIDADRMSFERLSNGVHIGRETAGLTEEVILERIKQRLLSPDDESHLEGEVCVICLEKFAAGGDIGALLCNHIFHLNCIKHWLHQRNLCPVCKRKALGDPEGEV